MKPEKAGAITGQVIGVASQASVADTFNVVTDFNNTGTQPAPGNPFTYGTETSLNAGFALFPNFQAAGTISVGSGQFTTDGTMANYYISEAISGPGVGRDNTGVPLSFSGVFTVPPNVLVMMPAAQLVQAMAAFGGGSGGDDSLNTAPLGSDTSQQTLLTTPQHA
jgi:hypothetical protein